MGEKRWMREKDEERRKVGKAKKKVDGRKKRKFEKEN